VVENSCPINQALAFTLLKVENPCPVNQALGFTPLCAENPYLISQALNFTLPCGGCQVGQRAYVGLVAMDRNGVGDYVKSTEDNVTDTQRFVDFVRCGASHWSWVQFLDEVLATQ
jgi:hypothetical protein